MAEKYKNKLNCQNERKAAKKWLNMPSFQPNPAKYLEIVKI